MKIKALLPGVLDTQEQKDMTKRALNSLVSSHDLKITEDYKKYKNKVAAVWNVFLKDKVGTEYDYLLITANDVEHDPKCIDFMVRCAQDNPKAGIISCKVTRDYSEFKKKKGKRRYTKTLTENEPKDPATFLMPWGVIEDIGFADEQFPCEFVERDLIYRAKLAGYDWIQPDVVLEYHPPYSGTIGNPIERLQIAYQKYVRKFGGDANFEIFKYPYNDINLSYFHNEEDASPS